MCPQKNNQKNRLKKSKAVVPSVSKKRVDRAVGSMSRALADKYAKIQKALLLSQVHELKKKHLIGVIINNVRKLPKKYGTKGVDILAKALRVDASSLYDYAKVAGCWNKEQVEQLCVRRSVSDIPISFSHLLEITVLDNKDEREKWINTVLNEGLSVRHLRRLLQSKAAPEALGEHLPNTQMPAPWVQGLQALSATTEKLSEQVQRVDEMLTSLPKGGMALHEQQLVEATLEAQDKVVRQLNETMARLRVVLTESASERPTIESQSHAGRLPIEPEPTRSSLGGFAHALHRAGQEQDEAEAG